MTTSPQASLASLIPTTQLHHFTLANGLKVYLQEDHRAPLACVQLWYHVGSSHDPAGHTNLAHVLEHMLFEGSSKLAPGQYSRVLARLGGSANATTLHEATVYEVSLPAARVEVALEIMADAMGNATLDSLAFSKAIAAVKNERRLMIDNNPVLRAFEHHYRLAHGASAYATPLYGDPLDLEYMKLETVRTWYRTWYHPNNATLVVVGDIDPARLQTWAARHFERWHAAALPQVAIPRYATPLQERQETLALSDMQDGLVMSFNVPGLVTATSPATVPALTLAMELLANGSNARLQSALVRNEQVLTAVMSGYKAALHGDTLLSIYARSNPAKATAQQAAERAWAIIETFTQQPPTAAALEQAKRRILSRTLTAHRDRFQYAQAIGHRAILGLPLDQLDSEMRALIELSPQEVNDAAAQFLVKTRLTTTLLSSPAPTSVDPQEPSTATLQCADLALASPAVDLSTLDSITRIDTTSLGIPASEVQAWQTSQGSQVAFVAERGSPVFSLQLRFQAGAGHEGDTAGVAALTLYMLDQGADGLDAQALAERFTALGATLQRSVSHDHATLTLSGWGDAAARDQAVDLLVAVAARPTFDALAFDGIKARVADYVRRQEADPTQQAHRRIRNHQFGDHPYTRESHGTSDGIAEADLTKVRAFHTDGYTAARLDITLLGDLTREAAERLCERIASALPQPLRTLPTLPKPEQPSAPHESNIERAGSNSSAWLALPLRANPGDPDYPALEVACEILGNGFESRLMRELRDLRALTYAIQLKPRAYSQAALLGISWDIEPAYRDASLALVKLLIRCFIEHGPSQGEVEVAVNQLGGRVLDDFANDERLLRRIAEINAHGLPADHYAGYLSRLVQLTPADLQAALTRVLDLDNATFVSVGPVVAQKALPALAPTAP